MKVKEAKKITDSFTRTTKMPGPELQPASVGMQNGQQVKKNSWQRLRQLLRSEG